MVLQARNIEVTFGNQTAVAGVTVSLHAGEILGLLGPSGCGKSTFLRAISGLVPLANGSVSFDGQDITAVPVHRRSFGFVFQDGQLFSHMSVAANVQYGLPKREFSRVERDRRVSELLQLVGLQGYEGRNVTTLSGGEKQRVALARALAPKPRVLLLDEPLSALDRELRERLALDVREILKVTQTTAIFVTHDQDEAFTVSDNVAVMRAGKILQVDTPEQLWRHPRSREVAEFLGYEVVLSEHPFAGFAPCDFEVVETMEPGAADVLAQRFQQGDLSRLARMRVGEPLELAGVVIDKYFQAGRAVARVDVPGLGIMTALAGALRIEPHRGVRLLRV